MPINKYGSKWRAFLYLGKDSSGKQIRKSKVFEKHSEAKKWEAEMISAHNKGVNIVGSKSLFKDMAQEWYDNICLKKDSLNTSYNKLSVLNSHILPVFGDTPLNKITTQMVQQFYFDLNNAGLKASTSKKIMATLTNVLKYCLKQGKIQYLPTDIEKLPVVKDPIKYWNEEQLKLFLENIKVGEGNQKFYVAVLLVSMTGVRSAELMGLQLKNYDSINRTLEVNSQVIKDKVSKKLILSNTMKTATSSRKLSLPKLLCDVLDSYIEKLPYNSKNSFLIGNEKGEMEFYDNLRMKFNRRIMKIRRQQEKEIREKPISEPDTDRLSDADIDDMLLPVIKFYELRHTHATILLNNGENIKVLSERLGHKNITTTLDTYASVMQKSRTKTADLLDGLFS